jgi:phasin
MIEKSDVRVRKRTEAPAFVSHNLVRQARGGYPRQPLTIVASEGPRRKSHDCRLQLARKDENPVSDASMKVEANTKTSKAKVAADETRGFDMPLFTVPENFREIAEQGVVRARDNCEKMKTASEEIVGILRESCSTNARGVADYSTKVVEISGVNTNAAIDFLTDLMATKSLSDIMQLSATQGRKNFEAASAQNRELWELAQKVATATAEPIKQSFTRVLQKAP